MAVRLRAVVVLGVLLALMTVGCSAKKKKGAETTAAGAGLGEEGLGAGSSLERYKQGTLAAGEQGPLKDIYFAFDAADLDETARSTLRENANWLKDHSQAKAEIEGHCDERGTVEYNLALGTKRAAATKEYLVALGVAGDRLTTISYGEELPLCQEHNEDCWQRNRRAHFAVLSE